MQAAYGNTFRCADVDPPVGNHGCDEFIVREVIARTSGLIEIVKFIREVGRILSVKDSRAAILDDPDNAIGRAACGNAGSGTQIRKAVGRMRRRTIGKQCVHDGKIDAAG